METCRFKIRQPPPATGIRLFYRPGPIAPGLATEILVEVYAIAAGVESGRSGVGLVEHPLQLITDTDVMHVPIGVRVMTAHAYDKQPDLNLTAGVELVSKGAPVREGIIRPRRDVSINYIENIVLLKCGLYLRQGSVRKNMVTLNHVQFKL